MHFTSTRATGNKKNFKLEIAEYKQIIEWLIRFATMVIGDKNTGTQEGNKFKFIMHNSEIYHRRLLFGHVGA